MLDEAQFHWHETLGLPPDTDAARRTMRCLAHICHRPRGSMLQQMTTSQGSSPPLALTTPSAGSMRVWRGGPRAPGQTVGMPSPQALVA